MINPIFNSRLSFDSQNGSVLPISLFILLVLTIIGAASLNDTVMEEKMSSNFQKANTAFQAAESSINRTYINVSANTDLALSAIAAFDASDADNPPVWPEDDPYPNPDLPTQLTARVQFDPKKKQNLEGCTISVGMPTTCSAIVLDVVASGQVNNTQVRRTHTQGIRKPLPAGG